MSLQQRQYGVMGRLLVDENAALGGNEPMLFEHPIDGHRVVAGIAQPGDAVAIGVDPDDDGPALHHETAKTAFMLPVTLGKRTTTSPNSSGVI
jgi:hypothetical protein